GVGDFQASVEGDGDQGDRFAGAPLLEGELAAVVDDQLVLVELVLVAWARWFADDSESGGLLALQEPAHLVARADVGGGLGRHAVSVADGVDGVCGEAERPTVAGAEAFEEGAVVVGVPAGGGGPAGLLDQVGQVG